MSVVCVCVCVCVCVACAAVLRASSLVQSSRLLYVDLSDTSVDETLMTSFLPSLENLRTLIVAGCPNLDNGFMRILGMRCSSSITAVDVSRNPNINANGVAWLAGAP
jgi:hypothetical protein